MIKQIDVSNFVEIDQFSIQFKQLGVVTGNLFSGIESLKDVLRYFIAVRSGRSSYNKEVFVKNGLAKYPSKKSFIKITEETEDGNEVVTHFDFSTGKMTKPKENSSLLKTSKYIAVATHPFLNKFSQRKWQNMVDDLILNNGYLSKYLQIPPDSQQIFNPQLGVYNFVSLVNELLNVEENGLVFLESPESIAVHLPLLTMLGSVICDITFKKNIQMIVLTESENILKGIEREVPKASQLISDNISLTYLERIDYTIDGLTVIHNHSLGLDGSVVKTIITNTF